MKRYHKPSLGKRGSHRADLEGIGALIPDKVKVKPQRKRKKARKKTQMKLTEVIHDLGDGVRVKYPGEPSEVRYRFLYGWRKSGVPPWPGIDSNGPR